MQKINDMISIVALNEFNKAFRESVKTGTSAVFVAPSGKIESYCLKDILKDDTPKKIEHTCNGERYLTNCKACKINYWQLQGLKQDQIDLLLSTEKEN